MPTVIATPGAANATSYLTVAEADAYLDARPNVAAWTGASADARARAVITATRLLSPLPWRGSRTTAAQALAWPRADCPNPDAPWGVSGVTGDEWIYYASDVIPQRVKDACAELALELLNAGTSDLATLDGDANLTAKSIGPLSKAWGAQGKPQGMARFPFLLALLAPLLDTPGLARA